MRFKIDDRVFDLASIQSLTIRDVLAFDREAAREGLDIRWVDLEEMNERLAKLKPEQRKRDPGTILLMSVSIWASRVKAGEEISYSDAIDIPLERIEFIEDPADKSARARPTKARPTQPSGRAAKRAAAKASVSVRSSSARTSKAASTDG